MMESATNSSVTDLEGDSFEVIVAKTVICMLVLAVSLIENILVLVVLKKDFRKRLRTANSYFIANMSTADVLFAVQNLPLAYNNFVMGGHWVLQGNLGTVLCKIDMFFSLISMVTSNLTILAIALARFLAVYSPYKKIVTRKVCFLIIFLTWFISTVFASPMMYYATLRKLTDHLTQCTVLGLEVLKLWYIILGGILTTTLIAMLVFYIAIGLKLWRRRAFPGQPIRATKTRREKRNRDIFKMLVTLVVVFYVCSVPVILLSLSHFFGFYTAFRRKHGLFIAVVMLFMNGVINPIIYYVFNENFRDGVKVVLAKCGCCQGALYALEVPKPVKKEDGVVCGTSKRTTRTSTQL